MARPLPDLDTLLREREWLARLTRRLLGDGPDADDLAQETLTRALRHAGSAGQRESKVRSARGWLATIARNVTHERRRADARRAAREREVARSAEEHEAGVALDAEAIDRTLLRRELIDGVLRLPEPERSVLVLHYFEGLSHAAIAERLGISPAASRKRVSRSVQRLRDHFERGPSGLASLAVLLVPLDAVRRAAPAAALVSCPASATAATYIMSLQAKLALGAAALVLAAVSIVSIYGPIGSSFDRAASDEDPVIARQDDAPASVGQEPGAVDGDDGASRTALDIGLPATPPVVTHMVSGRVVDTARRPVAGAEVSVRGSLDGAFARTASDGSFRFGTSLGPLRAGQFSDLAIVAHDGGERSATAFQYRQPSGPDGPGEVDAGTLVLDRSHTLEVHVPGDADVVSVALSHERRPWGDFELDGEGRVVIERLPTGVVHLAAHTDEFEARAVAFVPESTSIELELVATTGLNVAIRDARTGEPVAGARLTLSELIAVPSAMSATSTRRMAGEYHMSSSRPDLACTTGADGDALVDGLASGVRFSLRVAADGYRSPERGANVTSETGSLELELEPSSARSVRWPIVAGELPVPDDGTQIALVSAPGSGRTLELSPGAAVPSIVDGELVVPGLVGRARLLASTPDGAIARIYVKDGDERGPEISFRRPRQIRVRVEGPDGSAVDGAMVEARNQGNNSLSDPTPTGENGVAVLEGLHGGRVEVHVTPGAESGLAGGIVGTVDLDEGDATLDVTLDAPARRRARLRIRVADEARLPARYALRGMSPLRVVEEDPDRAELLVELTAVDADQATDQATDLWLDAAGYGMETISVRFESDTDVPEYDVSLEPTAVVVARVIVAEGERVHVRLEVRDAETGTWTTPRRSESMSRPNGPQGTYIFQGVTPGEWRLFDNASKVSSDVFVVAAGGAVVEASLDLGVIAWVSGIVEIDEPGELERVRILVDDGRGTPTVAVGRPGMSPPQGSRLEGGAFRVRIPGDREVTVSVWHPWLVPDAEAGQVTLLGGRDSVVLRLRSGDELRMPVPQLVELERSRAANRVRIARFPAGAEPKGSPIEWTYAPIVDGVLRCGVPAGTWTLLVDAGERFAPLVLSDVVVDGVTELPAAVFDEGSAVVVNLLLHEGTDAPRIYAFASSLDAPIYSRDLNSDGESPVRLTGLGPGRFKVVFGSIMDHENRRELELELDGEHDVEVELDAR